MRVSLEVERFEAPEPGPAADAVASRLRERGYRVVETSSGEFPAAFREAAGREPPEGPGRPPLFAIALTEGRGEEHRQVRPSGNGEAFFAAALREGEGLRLDLLRFAADHPEVPLRVFFVALGDRGLRAEMEANPGALLALKRIREAGGLVAAPKDAAATKTVEFLHARGLVFLKGGHVYLTAEGNALARTK